MIAVFYDRKNKQEVSSDQLMPINFVEYYAVADHEGERDGCPLSKMSNTELYVKECQLGSIGYKSKNCHDYANWDLYLTESDLVFLRLEELK